MVIKSFTAILCITLLYTTASAQENIYNRKGMLSGSATFSTGYMTVSKGTNFYLQGFLEARIEKHLSVRGDIYYLLGEAGANDLFKHHHTLLFGALYHFDIERVPNLDINIGLQPGISVSQLNPLPTAPDGVYQQERVGISPVISALAGVTYYVSPYFHFFAAARYQTGRHFSSAQGTIPLSEISFSAGMGVNLNVLKLKKRA